MDRLNQVRGEAASSRDLTLDTTSPPSEAFMTANDSSSKYFSLSEVDSTFEISPSKDALPQSADSDQTLTPDTELITNLSPIPKKSDLDNYNIGKQIEAANILSGGVDIFDDNENSYDGNELVIDDNAAGDDGTGKTDEKLVENAIPLEKPESVESSDEPEAIPSKDTEVVLQIDGKNVDAIDIGNGLYLYRKAGQEELAAVQIVDDDQQQPSFKFLKVRENAEGNLEVYEEIEIEIPSEVPTKEGNSVEKLSHVPIKDINKVINENATKVVEKMNKTTKSESVFTNDLGSEPTIDIQIESKSEVNLNGKMMKFNESRKSPVIGTFTPMTYHSTPNKEGIPLTKTMVDQQLHPSRHSDNIKKTIEVHTDSCRQKLSETSAKNKESSEITKTLADDKTLTDDKTLSDDKIIAETAEASSDNTKDNVKPEDNILIIDNGESNKEEYKSNMLFTEKEIKENLIIDEKKQDREEVLLKNSTEETNLVTTDEVIEDIKDTEIKNDINFNDSQSINEKSFKATTITQNNEMNEEKCVIKPQKIDSICENELSSGNENSASNVPLAENTTESNKQKETVETNVNQICLPAIPNESKNVLMHQKEIHMSKEDNDGIKSKSQNSDNRLNNKVHVAEIVECSNKNEVKKIATEENKQISSLIKLSTGNMELHKKDSKYEMKPSNIEKTKVEVETKTAGKEKNFMTDSNKQIIAPKIPTENNKILPKTEIPKKIVSSKPIINNNSAVPFGKWTEANRQEFLNKIKETKVPPTHGNTKQLKQPNDLNRRDVLKNFDTQRQSSTVNPKVTVGTIPKLNTKKQETKLFGNKPSVNIQPHKLEPKVTSTKTQPSLLKPKSVVPKKAHQDEPINFTLGSKKSSQRKEINNQDLIDKTIEGIINRPITGKATDNAADLTIAAENQTKTPIPIDDIELKMSELHGLPSEGRTSLENLYGYNDISVNTKSDSVKVNKNPKVPNLLPFKNKDEPNVKENEEEELSDEEIIEHEPITGDIDVNKQNLMSFLTSKSPEPRREAIITEKDFDKFARRNSITYENRLTMNFDGKEPHNVIQSIVEKEPHIKKLSRNEMMLAESKAKSTNKQQIVMRHNQISKFPISVKTANEEDATNKNYPSKVQIAYQTALTAKRQIECPITIIEDKPVKVVFVDSNMEFTSVQLNVQGKELSPAKSLISDSDTAVHSASESLDSDTLESNYEIKTQDETKSKTKHQRKQVLTPVEEPELELIEPGDLGIEVSPKKKRKLEDKNERTSKNLVPKKSYLLNRNIIDEHAPKPPEVAKNHDKHTENHNETFTTHTDAKSAIDNLVKAAELIETISEHKNAISSVSLTESPQNTPVKRGRGRPRKYPLPESRLDVNKTPSPQKKPRLIDAKPPKSYTDSDDSSDGEIIKENWTMGKINENIVCPICNKLFRSENVVFKHVKHCTGPSPNRSDSDKRSPRRFRYSHESDRKSLDSDSDYSDEEEFKIKNRKSKYISKANVDSEDVIVIDDTPIKEKKEKTQKTKLPETKKSITKNKPLHKANNIICEFCGKTFRQLSYLVHHKLQHKNEVENSDNDDQTTSKSVFSCEVCKKAFRKLHHLVQHRIIHNPNSMSRRFLRKSSSEQRDFKYSKSQNDGKLKDDASAGFRCEPCDKSFRKLHHLVEHRETHDGINKKGTNIQSNNESSNKPSIAYHCDKCQKIFKKLQDYLEHKDQHLETSSEKSDDKSVKSSLSTKDIIHECSLCYMVFPNEHSLNKHTVICLRKKRQSAAKQAAKETEAKEEVVADEANITENTLVEDEPVTYAEEDMPENMKEESETLILDKKEEKSGISSEIDTSEDKRDEEEKREDKNDSVKEIKSSDKEIKPEKRLSVESKVMAPDGDDSERPHKVKKIEENTIIPIPDTPVGHKKTPGKEKVKTTTVTKRHKSVNVSLPVIDEPKPMESSDDEEIRYMLNPNFKEDESVEKRLFMNVKAKKRNSLQFERPNSRDLVKRRTHSLQHPPKILRLKVKAVEAKPITSVAVEKKLKTATPEPLPMTDSDDSDVKYSFPKTTTDDSKDEKKKVRKQSSVMKRKSLGGIAKRKSLGKHKVTGPAIKIKKRTTEIGHRCDCGQLFSSAALLSRHTTLAHTPPRIRRRRSPPPDPEPQTKTRTKPKANVQHPKNSTQPSKSSTQPPKSSTQPPKSSTQPPKSSTQLPKTNLLPKKLKSDTTSNKIIKKSSVNSESMSDAPKDEFVGKKLRSSTHKAGFIPEKVKKYADKIKK